MSMDEISRAGQAHVDHNQKRAVADQPPSSIQALYSRLVNIQDDLGGFHTSMSVQSDKILGPEPEKAENAVTRYDGDVREGALGDLGEVLNVVASIEAIAADLRNQLSRYQQL